LLCTTASSRIFTRRLVLGDEDRLERAVAVAGNLDPDGPVVGEDRLGRGAVSVIVLTGGLRLAASIAEVVRHLALHGPFDDGLLEREAEPVDICGGHGPLDDLIQELGGDRDRRACRQVRRLREFAGLAWHADSFGDSCLAHRITDRSS